MAETEAAVVSSNWLSYLRGRADFKAGRPCPPKPSDDCDHMSKFTGDDWRWLGWMTTRGIVFLDGKKAEERAEALRRWAEEGAPLPSLTPDG